jgi:Uma2 family endonuclease
MAFALTADAHRMTADEYLAAAVAAGWERTELIEGFVFDLSPEHYLHARTCMAIAQALATARGDLGVVGTVSLRLDDHTVVQPDVVAVDERLVAFNAPVGVEAVRIVVEVSVTTRRRDMGLKAGLYASAGVGDYWVVDPTAGLLLRHTDPADGGYQQVDRFDLGDDVAAAVRRVLSAGAS